MIYNNQPEIWITLNKKRVKETTVIAISNCGRMKMKNGVIEDIPLKKKVSHNGKNLYCYRLLLTHFKPKTSEDERLNRDVADHITHNTVRNEHQ